MQTLTINGIEYAKYEMQDRTIFIKVLQQLPNCDTVETEDILIGLIQILESTSFKAAGYLNV